MEAGILQKALKSSRNIAIIADVTSSADSLCASIALMEIVREFLASSENFIISVYYLGDIPQVCEKLLADTKIYQKIGVRTLNIMLPIKEVDKILYNFEKESTEFKFSLVGFKGKAAGVIKNTKYKIESEKIDFIIGVGFKSESHLEKQVPYAKKIPNKHIFNKENMKSKSLCDGIFDIFCKEGIRPSQVASKAFFTYFSQN